MHLQSTLVAALAVTQVSAFPPLRGSPRNETACVDRSNTPSQHYLTWLQSKGHLKGNFKNHGDFDNLDAYQKWNSSRPASEVEEVCHTFEGEEVRLQQLLATGGKEPVYTNENPRIAMIGATAMPYPRFFKYLRDVEKVHPFVVDNATFGNFLHPQDLEWNDTVPYPSEEFARWLIDFEDNDHGIPKRYWLYTASKQNIDTGNWKCSVNTVRPKEIWTPEAKPREYTEYTTYLDWAMGTGRLPKDTSTFWDKGGKPAGLHLAFLESQALHPKGTEGNACDAFQMDMAAAFAIEHDLVAAFPDVWGAGAIGGVLG